MCCLLRGGSIAVGQRRGRGVGRAAWGAGLGMCREGFGPCGRGGVLGLGRGGCLLLSAIGSD